MRLFEPVTAKLDEDNITLNLLPIFGRLGLAKRGRRFDPRIEKALNASQVFFIFIFIFFSRPETCTISIYKKLSAKTLKKP